MMKKMYNEGDDELKKLMAKSWFNSQEKMKKNPNLRFEELDDDDDDI
jgi:hypothetical protein